MNRIKGLEHLSCEERLRKQTCSVWREGSGRLYQRVQIADGLE